MLEILEMAKRKRAKRDMRSYQLAQPEMLFSSFNDVCVRAT